MLKTTQQKLEIEKGQAGLLWFHRQSVMPEMGRAHFHDELEMNLVIKGSAQLVGPQHLINMKAGDLLWIPAGCEHLLIHESFDFEMWIAVFQLQRFERLLDSTEDTESWLKGLSQIQCTSTTLSLRKQFANDAKRLIAAGQSGDQARFNVGLCYLLLNMRATARSSQLSHAASQIHPCIQQVIGLLHDAHQAMSLEELAEACEMSPNHLGYLFRQQLGMSIVEFRQEICLERFFTLRGIHPRESMLQLALSAGFGSYAQFYRVFKARKGISPQVWQSNMKKR